jgi:hypothetical protein
MAPADALLPLPWEEQEHTQAGVYRIPPVQPPNRIRAGHAFVVHGLQFQFQDGSRCGKVLQDNHEVVPPFHEEQLDIRANVDIPLADGELILEVNGYNSGMGFLAHTVVLVTSHGRELAFRGTQANKRRKFFAVRAPTNYYIHSVEFQNGALGHVRMEPNYGSDPTMETLWASLWRSR